MNFLQGIGTAWTARAAECPVHGEQFDWFCPECLHLPPLIAVLILAWLFLLTWQCTLVVRYRRLRGKTVRIEKQALDRLHLFNSLLDASMEYADMEFFRCDANGKFLPDDFFTGKFWGKDARGNYLPAEEWIYPKDLGGFVQAWQRFASGQNDRVNCSYRAELGGRLRNFELCAGGGVNLLTGERFISGFIREVTRSEGYRAQLHDARALLDNVLENFPVRIYIKSVEQGYRYIMCSSRAIAFAENEIVGKTDFDLFGPVERAQKAYAEDCQLTEKGGEIERTDTFTPPNGKPGIYRIYKKLLSSSSGERLILVMVTDITEETRNRDQFANTTQTLENMIRFCPGYLFLKNADRDFRYELCGDHFAKLAGVAPADAIGKTDFELFPTGDAAGTLRRGDLETLAAGEYRNQIEMNDAAGTLRRIQLTRSCIRRADGDKLILGLGVDITEQRRILEAESEKNRLIDSLRFPAVLFDSSHRVIRFNAAAQNLSDREDAPIPNQFCNQNFCKFPTPPPNCPVRMALLDGKAHDWELSLGGRDYLFSAFPVLREGKVQYVLKTMTDVTETNQYRKNLQAAQNEAIRATQAKEQFLATISHQLRTPLNAILGFSELFRKSELSQSDREEYLSAIHQSGNRLLKLLDNLLELVRLDNYDAATAPAVTRCDFTARVRDAVERERTGNRVFKIDCAPDVEPSPFDAAAFDRILHELLANAVKFTPDNGGITVLLRRPTPESLELQVADNGDGIKPEALEHLFEAFYQQDHLRDTHRHQGSGLGLAIAGKLARNLGGAIRAESAGVGRGSVFVAQFKLSHRA